MLAKIGFFGMIILIQYGGEIELYNMKEVIS